MHVPALVKTISPPSGWEMQQLNPAEQNISIQVLVSPASLLEGVEISQNTVLLPCLLFAVGKEQGIFFFA